MKKFCVLSLLVVMMAVLGTSSAWAGKETICHFPPGNPANFHTITVGGGAVNAHINNHGDLLGSCLANCESICDDGNACTVDVEPNPDQCVCTATPRPLVDCDDGNACTADACDATNGTCTNDPTPLDGSACDDGDPGTTGEICAEGACSGCPCFTAADLAIVGGGSPTLECGNVPAFPGLAGIIWANGNRACSGTLCATPPPSLSCATLVGGGLNVVVVTPQEDAACRTVINEFCPSPAVNPLRSGEEEESTTPFIDG